MLRLITGPSGVGKTVFTLKQILAVNGCPKYATPICFLGFNYKKNNITKLDDLSNWFDLPPASILFCDDAEQFLSCDIKDLPRWLKDLSLHRHKKIDIYLTSLHPLLIHHYVRSLVSEHIHCFRTSDDDLIGIRKWPRFVQYPNSDKSWLDSELHYLKLSDFFSGVD